MVTKPEEYKWSSYLVNACGKPSVITQHNELKLGADAQSSCYAYRELFKHQLSEHDVHLIERASEYSKPIGDNKFRLEIETNYEIKLGQFSRGRTRKVLLD